MNLHKHCVLFLLLMITADTVYDEVFQSLLFLTDLKNEDINKLFDDKRYTKRQVEYNRGGKMEPHSFKKTRS